MTISNKIKRLRKEAKISQVDLAEKLGTTKQTIYKYENGLITNIPSDKIEIMARLFDTSPAYLMGWEDLPSSSFDVTPEAAETASMIHEAENTEEIITIVETVIEDEDYRAIVTASKELSPDEMKMVRAMIEGLVNKKE